MTNPVWDGLTIDPDALIGADGYGYDQKIVYGGATLPRFLAYMLAGINEGGAKIALAAAGFTATSTTSVTVGAGAKAFVVQAAKGFQAGMVLTAFRTSAPTTYMIGTVASYDAGTGALSLAVANGEFNGAGTHGDWTIQLSGRRGIDGIPGGFEYVWDAATADADPGAGKLRANNATLASATALYIDNATDRGGDIGLLIDALTASTNPGTKAFVILRHETDPSKWAVFRITAAAVDGTGYRKLTVIHAGGAGALAADDGVTVIFSAPAGDKGDTGNTGATGPTGSGSNIHGRNAGMLATAAPRGSINAINSLRIADGGAGPDSINTDLVGDVPSPNPETFYGTNRAGARGFQNPLHSPTFFFLATMG